MSNSQMHKHKIRDLKKPHITRAACTIIFNLYFLWETILKTFFFLEIILAQLFLQGKWCWKVIRVILPRTQKLLFFSHFSRKLWFFPFFRRKGQKLILAWHERGWKTGLGHFFNNLVKNSFFNRNNDIFFVLFLEKNLH